MLPAIQTVVPSPAGSAAAGLMSPIATIAELSRMERTLPLHSVVTTVAASQIAITQNQAAQAPMVIPQWWPMQLLLLVNWLTSLVLPSANSLAQTLIPYSETHLLAM